VCSVFLSTQVVRKEIPLLIEFTKISILGGYFFLDTMFTVVVVL